MHIQDATASTNRAPQHPSFARACIGHICIYKPLPLPFAIYTADVRKRAVYCDGEGTKDSVSRVRETEVTSYMH